MGETRGPGLVWKLLPDGPGPARSAAGQELQARSLAREFTSHFVDPIQGRWELRLLPAPLFQYGKDGNDAARVGAVAFCHTRDPEVILALEVRPSAEALRWHFACANFSEKELHVRRADAELWSVARGRRLRPEPGQVVSRALERPKLTDEVDNPRH